MNNIPAWLVAALISLAMCACASFTGQPGGGRQQTSVPGLAGIFSADRFSSDQLLLYAERYSELSADYQKQEYSQVLQTLGRNPKDALTRLKAALIFSMPASRYRDPVHALALLDELQREKQADDVSTLIAVLRNYVDDRQKLEDNNAKLIQKSRLEQRRADELQQKLDELKNIEKNMIDRQ